MHDVHPRVKPNSLAGLQPSLLDIREPLYPIRVSRRYRLVLSELDYFVFFHNQPGSCPREM